jgi:ankyrin repeat protein
MLHKLVDRKLRLNKSPGEEESHRILFWAAENGEHSILKSCLDSEPDVNSIHSKLRTTPLFFAAACGHRSCVDLLLWRGADLRSSDVHDRTALAWAAGPKVVPRQGITALDLAKIQGRENIVRLIERYETSGVSAQMEDIF